MREIQATIPEDAMEAAREIAGVNHRWIGPSEVAILAARAIIAERERWQDKIDGLSSDLDNAVETAFKRGATEWTRLNYPEQFARLSAIRQSKEHR